jgi:iron complex transport system substrate-binding protein
MIRPAQHGTAALLALAFLAPATTSAADAQQRPQRIVSMNLCTDELLMRIVDPSRIASITYLSRQPLNAPLGLNDIIAKIDVNHGLAEEVLMSKPDLIVTGSFSTMAATSLLRSLGQNIATFDPETDFDDMRANIRKMGKAVGEPERAEQVIADFDARLAELQAQLPPGEMPIFADIGVNNFMSGRDTLFAHVVNAGGWRTLGETLGYAGYTNIPLEQLLRTKPDLVSTVTPWSNPPSMSTQNLRHPALRELVAHTPQIAIPERYTTCGAPSVLGAVELLVEARKAHAQRMANQ